jgi:uncharacterized membrane protein
MIQTTLFIASDDPQFGRIVDDLSKLQSQHPHDLNIVRIEKEDVLQEEFAEKSPVLDIGIFRLVKSFSYDEMDFAFEKAEQRLEEAQSKGNDALVQRITQPLAMTKSDQFSHWFSHHYMVIVNMFTFLYVFLALLAPVMMKVGWERPAKVIYKVYSPLCHQLAFRSFFLFGEQIYYPRELANVEGILTYGQATGLSETNIGEARSFLGNETLGYKTALCQRDLAIYGAMLLFGIIFSLTGKKIKPLPWYLWLILGLGPIGLDGFSQLLSQTGLAIFEWLPLRESTPLLRTLTGAFFGLATAWFGIPYLEESVMENRREMHLKQVIVDQIEESNQ